MLEEILEVVEANVIPIGQAMLAGPGDELVEEGFVGFLGVLGLAALVAKVLEEIFD